MKWTISCKQKHLVANLPKQDMLKISFFNFEYTANVETRKKNDDYNHKLIICCKEKGNRYLKKKLPQCCPMSNVTSSCKNSPSSVDFLKKVVSHKPDPSETVKVRGPVP